MNYSTLISAHELNQIIENPILRLFDCRFNLLEPEWGYQQFQNEHIPNSQYADLNQQLAGPVLSNTGRHPLSDKVTFQNQLRKWGVDDNSQVVVYDDASGAIAARLWWMCLWAGLENVAVLDGGINAWLNLGLPVTKELTSHNETNFVAKFDDSLWVSTEYIETSIDQSAITLIDARAGSRYCGEHEPIDPIAGHIPTAINFSFEQNLDDRGHFLDKTELHDSHQKSTDEKQVISMCGSGVTACHNMLARKHAGLDMGKLYVGSWSEWITNPARPIEKD